MKYNINAIKSVWRRIRKPSRITFNAASSKNADNTEVFSETHILAKQADLTFVASLSKAGWGWLSSSPGFSQEDNLRSLTNVPTESVSLSLGASR